MSIYDMTSRETHRDVIDRTTDYNRRLADQPLPGRPGVAGRTYAEGRFMIMQPVINDQARGFVLVFRIDNMGATEPALTLINTMPSWVDALTMIDIYNGLLPVSRT